MTTLEMLITCSDAELKWVTKSRLKPLLDEMVSLTAYRQWAIERGLQYEHSLFDEKEVRVDFATGGKIRVGLCSHLWKYQT